MKKTLELTKGQDLIQVTRCAGPLTVRPADGNEVILRGEAVSWAEIEGGYEFTCQSGLDLRVPDSIRLVIQEVHGPVIIKGLQNPLDIQTIHGNTILKNAAGGKIQTVHGGLLAKQIQDDLELGLISGDLSFKHVDGIQVRECHGNVSGSYADGDVTVDHSLGDITLRRVSGTVTLRKILNDVILRDIEGIVDVQAEGDVILRGLYDEGKNTLSAAHDVILHWPKGDPLSVSGQGRQINNRLDWDEFEEKDGVFSGRIGKNGPHLEINAGGRVVFKSGRLESWGDDDFNFDFDFEFDLGRDFGRDFEAFGQRMAGLGEQIAGQVSRKMADLSSQLEGQFKAMRKREEAVRRAKERVNQYSYSAPPNAPAAPNRPAVDRARMKILEMLGEGKITVEEANELLKALE